MEGKPGDPDEDRPACLNCPDGRVAQDWCLDCDMGTCPGCTRKRHEDCRTTPIRR